MIVPLLAVKKMRPARDEITIAARGGSGLLLRGQRPAGDRPGSSGSVDARWSTARDRARPQTDAGSAGYRRDPVVHWLRVGRTSARPFEPRHLPSRAEGGTFKSLPSHNAGWMFGNVGVWWDGRDGCRQCPRGMQLVGADSMSRKGAVKSVWEGRSVLVLARQRDRAALERARSGVNPLTVCLRPGSRRPAIYSFCCSIYANNIL